MLKVQAVVILMTLLLVQFFDLRFELHFRTVLEAVCFKSAFAFFSKYKTQGYFSALTKFIQLSFVRSSVLCLLEKAKKVMHYGANTRGE